MPVQKDSDLDFKDGMHRKISELSVRPTSAQRLLCGVLLELLSVPENWLPRIRVLFDGAALWTRRDGGESFHCLLRCSSAPTSLEGQENRRRRRLHGGCTAVHSFIYVPAQSRLRLGGRAHSRRILREQKRR